MNKLALQIDQRGGPLSAVTGRIRTLPGALLVGQERALDWLSSPDETKLRQNLKQEMKDELLKDVVLRLNGTNTVDDYKRIWTNKKLWLPEKLFGSAILPMLNVNVNANRADHYNPYTNAANVYTNIPAITKHELGHAKSFEGFKYPSLIRAGSLLENMVLTPLKLKAGPLTQYLETKANNLALEQTQKAEDRREYRRRAWPARSTYITAAALSLAAMLSPDVRSALQGRDWMETMAKNLGLMGAGALAGRGIAEIRNLFDKDKPKKTLSKAKLL